STLWTRGILSQGAALWKGAEDLRVKHGIDPREIYGSWEWNCYRGAFDDYMNEVRDQKFLNFDDFLGRWLEERKAKATYELFPSSIPPENMEGEVIGDVAFRNGILKKQHVFVVRKGPRAQPGGVRADAAHVARP